MIKKIEEKHIADIAEAHCLAWQKGFQNILSDQLLKNLNPKDFANNWEAIIQRKNRTNYIFLIKNKAIGFISFGLPYDNQEKAQFEIYGIYVHPDYWKKGIGYQLMKYVINEISEKNTAIVLWVMSENWNSRIFYKKFGFEPTESVRMSSRNDEKFEEIKYVLTINLV